MIFGPTCAIDAWPGQGRRGSQASSAAPEAREHMGESADPFRLAIGVFHEPERLESAISDLFADNFVARDMCLVGTRQAFDRLLPMPVARNWPGAPHRATATAVAAGRRPGGGCHRGRPAVDAAQSRQVAGRRQYAALLAAAGAAGALVRAYRARRHRSAGQRAGPAAAAPQLAHPASAFRPHRADARVHAEIAEQPQCRSAFLICINAAGQCPGYHFAARNRYRWTLPVEGG